MKRLLALLSALLSLCLLTGCIGTPVIYHEDCDCPTDGATSPDESMPEDGLKTGLALVASAKDSVSATADTAGMGKYDVTLVAVTVDRNGVIRDCIIDGIASTVEFDNAGNITSDVNADIKTKNELGSAYGMVSYGGAKYEWNEQAQALADFAVGKTVDELWNGAVDETGKAPAGSDLASSATIYLGGYVSAIETAVEEASYLGATVGDSLHMASQSSVSGSADVNEKGEGTTQLETTVTVLTMKDGVITSCVLDSVQAKVSFDVSGTVTSDTSAPAKTKNELGSDYGMVAWGGAIAEWNEQAASFADYVTGKTPAQVEGIAVNEQTKPTEADLSSSVTIAVGDFQELIRKAAQ